MSTWIRAVCRDDPGFDPADVVSGIAQRLDLLSAAFCPDEEEPAQAVLARLAIEPLGPAAWALRWRSDRARFVRVERWQGAELAEEVRELEDALPPPAAAVREVLGAATVSVAFELKDSDVRGMGLPAAVAAAAWLAARGRGLVHVEGRGWFAPTAKEVKPVR